MVAFNDALADISSGRVDFALVGGASNILRPQTSLAFQRLHMLSPEVRPALCMPSAHHLQALPALSAGCTDSAPQAPGA
jgi:3-oxoacyl-(acyl-carrier-protein) synthase